MSSPSAPNTPRITIQMTDEDIIERVGQIFQVAVIKASNRKEHWRSAYRVSLRGRPALWLMKELRPLMGMRRQQQIDRAINDHDAGRRSKLRLSDDVVRQIYQRAHAGEPYKILSSEYSVGYATIVDIKLGRTWKHITSKLDL